MMETLIRRRVCLSLPFPTWTGEDNSEQKCQWNWNNATRETKVDDEGIKENKIRLETSKLWKNQAFKRHRTASKTQMWERDAIGSEKNSSPYQMG